MQILDLHGPTGTAWELLVVVVVIIAAPVLVERIRIPGLIGLLAGGCIIGPQVLGVVSDTTGILHELGEIGLLYLMFLAGLELDLGVFARYRNQAIGFMA
jgi:Kef-type K+ transport system membrane component KefB